MNNTIQLSKYEIWFLLSLIAPSTVIGFRNPTTGVLVEDMFPLIQEASFSLLDKDLIYVDSNNQIKIKDDLGLLIHVLTAPKHSILVAFRLNNYKKEMVRSFNFGENCSALLEELVDSSYLLQEIESKDSLLSKITEPFSDKVFWSPDTDALLFSEEEITLMQKSFEASNVEEAKVHLETARGEVQSKLHLFETLQNPNIRFSLIGFIDRNNPKKNYVNGFSIIAGERYLWLLEIIDEAEKIVCVSKITMKGLNKKISTIIPFSVGG